MGQRRGWWAGGVLVAMVAVAACGGDDGSSSDATTGGTGVGGSVAATTSTPATAADDVDPDGVIKAYFDLLTSGGPDFDPIKVRVSPPTYIQQLFYDSLFHVALDGTYEPGLAESAEIVDPSTVAVVLHEGIEFSDGTRLDADAVKFSIERSRDAKSTTLSAELQEIDAVTVTSPTELTIHTKTPIAGAIYDRLPYGDFFVVSPTAARAGNDFTTNPIGAGPFLLDSYEPGRVIRYKKNPAYFRADEVRAARFEIHHIEPGQGVVTGIQSGAVDYAVLSLEQANAIASAGWQIDAAATDSYMMWGQICKSRPPFNDLRVRQAINYAIDRDAINRSVFEGKGEPAVGFFASSSPLHDDASAAMYPHDPDKARQLLAEAGAANLTFDTFYSPGLSQRTAEIVQANLAEVGVTMNLKPLTNSADFFPDAKGAPMNIFPLERTGIQRVARTLVPGSVGNICGYDDPELNALVAEIKTIAPDSPQAVGLWADLQQRALSQAANLFGVFGVRATAYNHDRLGDVGWTLSFQGRPEIDVRSTYVKQ